MEVADGINHFVADTSELNIIDALVKVGLAKSKREAREFVSNGSVRINGEKITDLEYIVAKGNGLYGDKFFIRRGKKSYAFLKL